MSKLTVDEVLALADKATPGPWEWWTSNSVTRLSHDRDGDVMFAYRPRSGDPSADICVKNVDSVFIAAAPRMAELLREQRDEIEKLNMQKRALRNRLISALQDNLPSDLPYEARVAEAESRVIEFEDAFDAAIAKDSAR